MIEYIKPLLTKEQISDAIVAFLRDLKSKKLEEYHYIELEEKIHYVEEFHKLTKNVAEKKTLESVYIRMADFINTKMDRKIYNKTFK